MHRFFKYINLSFLLLICQVGFSQNFPVDCRVLLSPPYTGKFTDITNSPTKFRVQLLLKDLTKSSIDISLRIRLKGQGVWLENPEGFIASKPITLTPGVPKTFSALELAEYFAPQNIEAQGIDYAQLLNGLPLPFGFYEWEVLAIELYRNREVSNVGRGKFYIQNNYPPLLNMPRDESIVPALFPQNLLFSWTPRHITPALGTGGLLYHLYLYEIPEDDASKSSAADIQALINSGTPYMQELLSDKPYYNYGASNLPLTAGKRYAWQVRVESFNENDGFLNDGYSDIKSFVYGHLPCPRPTNLQAKVDADDGSVALTWEAPTDALSYKLSYYTLPNGIKTEKSVLGTSFLLIQQPVGYQYQWEVKSVCQQGESQATASDFELKEKPKEEAWESDPELTYEPDSPIEPDPEVVQTTDNEDITETSPEENIDEILNTPIKIFIPAEGEELPEGVPSSLTTLPDNATVEQLQEVLKSKKPTCAGISASYSCGNHDNVPQYNGTIVPVSAGDEIAMNSMVLSVVSIDGSGNGEGLIKLPMMNNIKIGVALSGIQVAEGGCVVAGKAETSGIDVAVLNDKQRQVLKKAYALYEQVLNVAAENAGAIAETYNSIADLYNGITQKTQGILDKVNDGKKISKAEQKALAEMKKKAKEGMDKQIAYFTKKFGSEGSDEIINLVNLASQSCTCEAYTETSEPKKGPNANAGEWILYDDDCKRCLEEDKKRQQEMAKLAKAFEEKLKAIKGKKMECGCGWSSIKSFMQDLGTSDKNCELVIQYLTQLKTNFENKQNTIFDVAEGALYLPLQGQINIGGECLDNLEITLGKSVINPQKKQYIGDILFIDDAFNLKTENIQKTKLLEKWLFDGVKVEGDTIKGEYASPEGAVNVSLLQTSELGKKMLRISEGCTMIAPKANRRGGYLYVDNLGYCTFGIGHLVRKSECTQEDKDRYLKKTWAEVLSDFETILPEYENYVKKHVKKPITQTEFDAMVSFCFNVGEGNPTGDPKPGFAGSNFLIEFNKGNRNGNLLYNYKQNPNRRKTEVVLFNTGKYTADGKDITNLKIACDGN